MKNILLSGCPVRTTLVVLILSLISAMPAEAARKLVASEIRGAKMKPGVVITNDSKSISAFSFDGEIRKALVYLRSTRAIALRPFGTSIYDSRAALNTPVPANIAPLLEEAARHHGVDPRLLAAVARRESRFSSTAKSPVGAMGVMQLMPSTAKYLGVSDAFDARQNIFGGARYLKELLDTFSGDLDLSLAAYNAGPGAVRKYRGIPPYRETQNYVAAIRRDYESSLR
jgi:soluble lytic murein transglycosylase-like protein